VELLTLALMRFVVCIVMLAGERRRGGFVALAIAGWLIVAANVVRYAAEIMLPGSWRSGAVPGGLVLGHTVASLLTTLTSPFAPRT